MSAQDFEPYWCRTGDVIERNRVTRFGPEIELLEGLKGQGARSMASSS
jgi:hypothetical protein